jgi:hypothetical protein
MLMVFQWSSASCYGGQWCEVTWLLGSAAFPFPYDAISDPSVSPDLRLFLQTPTDLSLMLEVTLVRRAGKFTLTATRRSEICSYIYGRHRNTAQT